MSLPVTVQQQLPRTEMEPELPVAPNWTIDVSEVRTVKVSNISLSASERDLKEFFSFSGDVDFVEMQRESEESQLAYVTFMGTEGADTAVLLSGATIGDLIVAIEPAENYQLPPQALKHNTVKNLPPSGSAVRRAEDVVSSMLAKGYILAKDALNSAKIVDERHHVLSNASATMSSLDRRIGLSDKIREVDERFQVSEITRSAISAAEHRASGAGAALMRYQYVSAGVSWLSGAFSAVAKAAGDVGFMTKEKVVRAEEERGAGRELSSLRHGGGPSPSPTPSGNDHSYHKLAVVI